MTAVVVRTWNYYIILLLSADDAQVILFRNAYYNIEIDITEITR